MTVATGASFFSPSKSGDFPPYAGLCKGYMDYDVQNQLGKGYFMYTFHNHYVLR